MRTVYHEGMYPIINKGGHCVRVEETLDAAIEWVKDNWVDGETIEMKIINSANRSTIVSFHEDEDDDQPKVCDDENLKEIIKLMFSRNW